MGYRPRLQRNNTSGLPGLRLRHRCTRTGLLRFFIEVSWQENARRAGTSIPVAPDKYLTGTARALAARQAHAGDVRRISLRSAWSLLVSGYFAANKERRHGR